MPLDVLGRTRATIKGAVCLPDSIELGNPRNVFCARDWALKLSPMNEEFPVSASHKLVLTTSLPFVHTARRTYRLNDSVNSSDCGSDAFGRLSCGKLFKPHHLEEGEVVTRFP